MTANRHNRIPELRQWAEADRAAANEDATAKELAILTFRASKGIYFFPGDDYKRDQLGRIQRLAEAQSVAAAEQSDTDEATRYRVVAEMAQEFDDSLVPGMEVRVGSDETRAAFEDLQTKNGDGILPVKPEPEIGALISQVKSLKEQLGSKVEKLADPNADQTQVRRILGKLVAATEHALEVHKSTY